MQLKDLRIVMDTAREYGMPLPSTTGNTDLYEQMIEAGMGELDNSGVLGVLERMSGAELLADS